MNIDNLKKVWAQQKGRNKGHKPRKETFRYSKELRHDVLKELKGGASLKTLSERTGIPYKTLSNWRGKINKGLPVWLSEVEGYKS